MYSEASQLVCAKQQTTKTNKGSCFFKVHSSLIKLEMHDVSKGGLLVIYLKWLPLWGRHIFKMNTQGQI